MSRNSATTTTNSNADDKWSRYERSRLQKLVVNYAAPRWHDMRVNAELTKRTLDEIKRWVLDFVRQCVRYSEDDSDAQQTFRDLLALLDAEAASKVSLR